MPCRDRAGQVRSRPSATGVSVICFRPPGLSTGDQSILTVHQAVPSPSPSPSPLVKVVCGNVEAYRPVPTQCSGEDGGMSGNGKTAMQPYVLSYYGVFPGQHAFRSHCPREIPYSNANPESWAENSRVRVRSRHRDHGHQDVKPHARFRCIVPATCGMPNRCRGSPGSDLRRRLAAGWNGPIPRCVGPKMASVLVLSGGLPVMEHRGWANETLTKP